MAITNASRRSLTRTLPWSTSAALRTASGPPNTTTMLSRRALQRGLGALWLLDGALQLFPSMWTSHLADDVMQPTTSGQPGLVVAALQPGIGFGAHHVVLANALIMVVQLVLGACLLTGKGVRGALVGSVVWSALVWVFGEGMGMLLTGQAGAFTGAPGAVFLYGLLALVAMPHGTSGRSDVFTRLVLLRVVSLFWALAAVLQLQPYWWQPGQLSATIAANKQPGTLNGAVLDPSISWAAGAFGHAQLVVNVAFIAIAMLLAVGLPIASPSAARGLLVVSMVLSAAMWWAGQGCGLILTGGSTDVNSGPLLILCALACWLKVERSGRGPAYSGVPQPGNA